VRVGLYLDLRNPPAWRTSPPRLYGFALELCEEFERLGGDSIWVTEHHVFDDDYLPQPLTFAAAIAARTSRVRIGTGILIAPLHRPVEIAEQAAVVDILSDGRLDLGIGAGYRVPEYELYDADIATRYRATDATARELRRLWGPDGATPRPVQERLPIWLGYQGPKGARRAGVLGENLLTANQASWPAYRDALVEAGHDPATARMAGGIQGWVTDDPDADWPEVSRHLAYQVDSYRRHMVQGTGAPTPKPIDPEKLRAREPRTSLDHFFYGTPQQVAERVRDYAGDAPVDTVYFWASIGGMPEATAARHVQTLCAKLAPLLE
jgi:alkanesulfonate monooxygenase SsuD/methylene tetrahydromethanopterin reductase-like flavin-dependent oxidoreductase (luciferase family)